jgi:hypothetical protein
MTQNPIKSKSSNNNIIKRVPFGGGRDPNPKRSPHIKIKILK